MTNSIYLHRFTHIFLSNYWRVWRTNGRKEKQGSFYNVDSFEITVTSDNTTFTFIGQFFISSGQRTLDFNDHSSVWNILTDDFIYLLARASNKK